MYRGLALCLPGGVTPYQVLMVAFRVLSTSCPIIRPGTLCLLHSVSWSQHPGPWSSFTLYRAGPGFLKLLQGRQGCQSLRLWLSLQASSFWLSSAREETQRLQHAGQRTLVRGMEGVAFWLLTPCPLCSHSQSHSPGVRLAPLPWPGSQSQRCPCWGS